MKVLQRMCVCSRIVLCLFFINWTPAPTDALLEDVLDVFHIVKEVTVTVLKTWDIVREVPVMNNINIPLMREKQQKVISRLKEVSKQIAQTENQHSDQISMAIDTVNNFVESNLQLMHKRNEISDIINRIRSRFQQMKTYEAYRDKLEESTLLAFAQWTVSPNAYSIQSLMERLFLIIFDSETNLHRSNNLFELLLQSYEVIVTIILIIILYDWLLNKIFRINKIEFVNIATLLP